MSKKSDVFTFVKCNDNDFTWINKKVLDYPAETSRMQYTRSKFYSCVSYLNENDLLSLFDFMKSHNLESYCYIQHTDDDVEKHWHILLGFSHALSPPKLLHMVNVNSIATHNPVYRDITFSCQRVKRGIKDMLSYFVHEGKEGKKHYEWSDCKSDNMEFWRNVTIASDTTSYMEQLIADLENKMTFRQLAAKYGRDFVLNYKAYYQYYAMIRWQENCTPVDNFYAFDEKEANNIKEEKHNEIYD